MGSICHRSNCPENGAIIAGAFIVYKSNTRRSNCDWSTYRRRKFRRRKFCRSKFRPSFCRGAIIVAFSGAIVAGAIIAGAYVGNSSLLYLILGNVCSHGGRDLAKQRMSYFDLLQVFSCLDTLKVHRNQKQLKFAFILVLGNFSHSFRFLHYFLFILTK